MRRRRVKVTGIGPVTPAGIGAENFWSGICKKRSYIRKFIRTETAEATLVAAHISDFVVKKYIADTALQKGVARHTEFAAVAALLAVQHAGLSPTELSAKTCAVVAGASLLDFGGIGKSLKTVFEKGYKAAQPRVVFTSTLTSVSETIADVCRVNARTMAVQTSCCAGLDAIGHAARLIESGEVEIAICGGTEAPLYSFPLFELQAAGLTPNTNESPAELARPFDLWRTTGVVSEGACFFILESEASPRPAIGWISGYGFSSDSRDEICSGLVDANLQAIADAEMRPSDVQCISAWGPGHRLIDKGEFQASKEVFGASLIRVPAYSIKGAIGSPLGAAPAIQLASAILGMNASKVPPTVNWKDPDPECAYCLSENIRFVSYDNVLVNAHGVGNVNSSLLITK